jgi:hypothetical protein
MVALCEGLHACPALEELDLGESEEDDRDGGHQVLVQGLSGRISAVLLSLLSCSYMHSSPPPCILFLAGNCDIGIEEWAAVGRALSSMRNLKKLYLGEERGNESSSDPDHRFG